MHNFFINAPIERATKEKDNKKINLKKREQQSQNNERMRVSESRTSNQV